MSFEYAHTGSNNYILGNIDLLLYDSNDNLVACSQTTNNVEIIRFEEDYSGLYKIVVRQTTPPTENGISCDICYSIAWYIEEYDE